MINIDFRFRAVGQGAFYSGVFKHRNGNQFSFVYDCGTHSTRSYIEYEIDSFVHETAHKKIDILLISHFHDDHINKISELLDQAGGAKIAILPYLTPNELLLAYIDANLSGAASDALAFIRDSTTFLLKRNVEKIIYIHPDDEPDSGSSDQPFKRDMDPESPDFEFRILNNLKLKPDIENSNSSVLHCFDTGSILLTGLWEFKFFSKPRTKVILEAFLHDIATFLSIQNFNFNDLVNYIDANPSSFDHDFNLIYSRNFGAKQLINDTSLIVYHGALIKTINRRIFRRGFLSNSTGTLLTGDIKFDENCLNDLRRKWIDPKYINNVDVFQIPHHGADQYIAPLVVSTFQNVYWWVINFGLGNKHKHPRQNIIDIIQVHKVTGKIFSNTQTNDFGYGCFYR